MSRRPEGEQSRGLSALGGPVVPTAFQLYLDHDHDLHHHAASTTASLGPALQTCQRGTLFLLRGGAAPDRRRGGALFSLCLFSLSLYLSLADYAPVSRRLARQAQSPHALQSPARFAAWPAAGHECGMASCKLSPTAKPGRGFRRARLYAELGRRGLNAATRQDYIKSWPPPPWRPSTLFYTSDWVLPSFLPALLACFLPAFRLSFLPSLLPLIKSAPSVALLHHSLRFASPFATTLFPLLSFTPVLARLGRYANLLRLAA